jgi:hypothetical protein
VLAHLINLHLYILQTNINMRCFILFAVATLFASVVAAPAPAPAPAAEEPAAAAACSCAADKNGAEGELMNFGGKWYQCIYPSGTCIWDDVS